MSRLAWLMVTAFVCALVPTPSLALPSSTNGLVVSSATLQVKSVSTPSSWVPSTTVYEGSPARLVLSITSPGPGTVRTRVTLPGLSGPVADAVTSVGSGSATLAVSLDLSYGAWLTGSTPNSADSLDVSVEFTSSPPASDPLSTTTDTERTPTPLPSPAAVATVVTDTPSALPQSPARTAPVRVVVKGSPAKSRSSVRRVIRSTPAGSTVVVVIRPSRSSQCPTSSEIRDMVSAAARSLDRAVQFRTGTRVSRGCARLELSSTIERSARSGVTSGATTFAVPLTLAPRPLILIHGMWSSASIWSEYTGTDNVLSTAHSRWRGYAVSTMDTGSVWLPYASVNTVAQNASLAWDYVQARMSELNAHEVDIASHSLGGVITRRMLHDPAYGSAAQSAIRSVVLMGVPNGGSSCSDAWAVPANRELTYTAMDSFNLLYPGYPGTVATSLYSDHFGSTCFDSNAGDLFVPAWSTQAQSVNTVRKIEPGVQHSNMPSSSSVFNNYVRPALALASAPADAGPTPQLTNPSASSTVLFTGTETVMPLSVTKTVTIESGSSLVASVVGDAATTGNLTYPSGGGPVSVAFSQIGSYPVFEAEVSYASLGGTGAPVVVSVTINATTTAASPELRWSLVTRR